MLKVFIWSPHCILAFPLLQEYLNVPIIASILILEKIKGSLSLNGIVLILKDRKLLQDIFAKLECQNDFYSNKDKWIHIRFIKNTVDSFG
jgi:hypothetical protein